MAKCEITSNVLNELETQINNDLYNIDPDEELSSDEFLTQCKDYFNTKLKEIADNYNLTKVNDIINSLMKVLDFYSLTELGADFFNFNSLKNNLLQINRGIVTDNSRTTASTKLIERVVTNLDINDISDEFLLKSYGEAIDVRLQAQQLFNELLVNHMLLDRENGRVINSTSLNQSIKMLQEKLLNNIYRYLKLYRIEDIKEIPMYNEEGEYTNALEVLKQTLNRELTFSSQTLLDLRRKSFDGNKKAKAQLLAYNSKVLLDNFDTYVRLKFGKNIEIQNFGEFTSNPKYHFAKKGVDNNTTWRRSDNIDISKETSGIIKMLISTTKMYTWNQREVPVQDSYLSYSMFSYMIAKVKQLGFNPKSFNIDFTDKFSNINVQVLPTLSRSTQTTLIESGNLANAINLIRLNPQKYLSAIFEILSSDRFYNIVKQNIDTNIYSDFKSFDKNILVTITKGIFTDDNSIRRINAKDKSVDYYQYIAQNCDSLSKVNFLQYYVDENNTVKIRTLQDSVYDTISRQIQEIIEISNSKTLQSPIDIDIEETSVGEQFNGIKFFIPNSKLQIFANVDGSVKFLYDGKQINTLSDWNIVKTFIDDILKQNLQDNVQLYNMLLEEYNNVPSLMITDLTKFASRVLLNKYISNVKLKDVQTVNNLNQQISSIYAGNKHPKINYQLGELSLIHPADVQIIKYLTNAIANYQQLLVNTSVKDSQGNQQSSITFSRLIGSRMSQYILQNKQEHSATKYCLLVTNPGIIKEIYTVKELKNQASNKEYIDFNVSEFTTSVFLHDFIGGLCSIDEQTRHVVGNGIIGLIPSVNSDKSTIGRILIDLNEIIGNKSLKEFNNYELKALIASEFRKIYEKVQLNIDEDLILLCKFANIPITNQFIYNQINDYYTKQGLNPYEEISKELLKYNLIHRDKPLELIDQVHFIVDKNGNLLPNNTLHSILQRFAIDTEGFTNDFRYFFEFQNKRILKDLIENKFLVDLSNENSAESIYLRENHGDWINDSGYMVLARIDGQPITSKLDLIELAQKKEYSNYEDLLKDSNIELHPELERYNLLDYLFSEEFLITTVGSHIAHPAKYKGNDPLIEEGLRKKAQNKRNVSMTATMQEFLLNTVNGIPNEYNIAIIKDKFDTLYNASGIEDDSVKPYDGATFVNPFIVLLENISLGAAKAGITKKQFIHFYNERTATGGIIKTAGFGMTNDWIRNSYQLQNMMRKMTDIKWNRSDIDITQNENGVIDYGDIFYKENGLFYKVLNIKYKGSNNYDVTICQVTEDGDIIENTVNTISKPIDSNYKLWQLFGGMNSHELVNNKLIPSERSVHQVVHAMNNIYFKHSDKVRVETAEDADFPLKQMDIHYVVTEGAIKQGAANINRANIFDDDTFDDDTQLNFMRIKLYQAGIQLDKEHNADESELSLITQVISACASRGYTLEYTMNLYNSLTILSRLGTKSITDAVSKYVKFNDKKTLKEEVNKIIIKALSSNVDSNNFASIIAKDIIEQVRNNKQINWADNILPMSDNTIYRKLVSTITVELTRSGIKQEIPGILSVLTPSFNIMKLYGDRKLDSFANKRELQELQAKYDNNPVFSYISGTTKGHLSDLELGRKYRIFVKRKDGVTEQFDGSTLTPREYWELKKEINQLLPLVENLIISENVIDGRELASYNCRFETNRGTYQLYDLQSVQNLFLLKEYLDNNELIKIVDLALNNIDLTTIQNRINLFNSNIKKDLELLFSDYFTLNDFLSLIQSYNLNLSQIFDQKFVEKYLRRFVQRDYNILSGVDSSDVLKTTDGYVRITNKESLKVQPYELIMPKIFINEFGLDQYDDLYSIKNDKLFFVKRLQQHYTSNLTNEQLYDIELKRLNGHHYYILQKENMQNLQDVEEKVIFTRVEDNNIYRVDDNNQVIYELSSKDDKIFVDKNGVEIIVTDNPQFYIKKLNYNFVKFTQRSDADYEKLIALLKDIKKLQHFYDFFNFSLDKRKANEELANIGSLDLTDQNLATAPFPFKTLVNQGLSIHSSFLKSLDVIAARIPAQSMQSFMPMKVVAFDNPNINTAYVSTAQIWLQGSDYDIDAVSLATFTINKNGIIDLWSPYAKLTSIEELNESCKFPFPTGEKTDFDSYEAKEGEDSNFNLLLRYIGNGKIVNTSSIETQKVDKERVTEVVKEITVNKNIPLYLIRDLLENAKNIKIPTLETMNILSQKFKLSEQELEEAFNILKEIIDNHNLYLEDVPKTKLINISQNYSHQQIWNVAVNPSNLLEAQSSVDGTKGPIKEASSKSKETQDSVYEVPGNFVVKFKDVYRNQVGKKGVGICAVGLKNFFALTQYYNYILNYGTEEQQKHLLFKQRINGKTYQLLSNVLLKNKDNVTNIDLLNALNKVNNDIDAAIVLSALLSLATD